MNALLRGPHLARRKRTGTWILIPLLLLGSGRDPVAAQDCEGGIAPDYGKVMAAIARIRPALDTVTLRGTLHVALDPVDGRLEASLVHADNDAAPGGSECRMAFLWTSRGDSLITVSSTAAARESEPRAAGRDSTWALLDKPRPVPFTVLASVEAPQIARALLQAYHRSVGPPAEPTTTVLLLMVDSTGRGALSRIARSSGVRRLDEAALRLATEMSYLPARDRGTAVAAWFVMHVKWHPRSDSLQLRCC